MKFIKLEKLINLHDGYQRCFDLGKVSVLLIHQGNQSYLFHNRCPHMQKPLGDRCLKADHIQCPWHGMKFDLNGKSINSTHEHLQLKTIPLAYEENYLGLNVSQV